MSFGTLTGVSLVAGSLIAALMSAVLGQQTWAAPSKPIRPSGSPSSSVKTSYKPVRAEFWNEVDRLIAKGKAAEVFSLAAPPKEQGSELEEWKVGVAKALAAAGQPLHAQYFLSNLVSQAVATRQSFEALKVLNQIARANPIDEPLMEELAFDLDAKIEEPETRSLVGYFRARALQRKGYADWSQQALAEVAPGTTWSEELEYDRTLQVLSSGDAATAYGKFEALSKSPNTRRTTAKLSRLALARLIFERRDYKASIEMYRSAELPVRERARSLNELAWSYYYDREYGKALGVIRALKTTYFERLFSPESAVLEILIYRELCHYERVRELADAFRKTFSDVYKSIQDRLPLENVSRILQAALQEGVLQKRATVIQMIRQERRELLKQKWMNGEVRDELLKFAQKRERMTDLEVQRMLRDRVDSIANVYLDLREQVWYLDYEASLRLIQKAETMVPDYEPPQKSTTQTNDFFWPVGRSGEAWLDELLNYEVLVRGKCQAAEKKR